MAIRTKWFTMDGKEGVDLNNIITSQNYSATPSDPSYPQPGMNLGDRVQGNNGSEWMFVIASATVTAFNFLAIDRNFGAVDGTSTVNASNVYTFGVFECQGLVSTDGSLGNAQPGDCFWAMMKVAQGARVNVVPSVSLSPGAKLYISPDLPGFLTTSATLSQIVGIFTAVSVTSGTSLSLLQTPAEVGMFTYPFPGILVSLPPVSTTA